MEDINKELHRIATTVIIYRDDGKYLITRRALNKKAFPGMWTVPGGGLTVDDYVGTPPSHANGQWYNTLEKTIRREVSEEVGLEVGKPEFLLDIAYIRPDNVPEIILSYYAPYVSGDVIHDIDTIDSAWVTLEEAKNYDLIEGILGEIEMTEKILGNK